MIIKELLNHESFKSLKIINKNANLDREVSTIESTETPDIASFLPKNSLLITTAMAYKNNQKGICQLIKALNELPCAGLAIKLGRFVNELDPKVIEIADELEFPLIQIPIESTLGEIYHQLLAFLWNDQNAELSHALNTQKKFSNLILQGASTKVMLNNLGYTFERPVAILTPFGEVLESNSTCSENNIKVAKRLFNDYQLYSKHVTEMQHYMDRENGKKRVSIYSIKIVGKNSYYLYIFDSEKLPVALTTVIVDHVLLILGVSLYKELYVSYNGIRNKEDFLNILVNKYRGEEWSEHQKLTLGKKFGLKQGKEYNVIIGTLESFKEKKFNSNNFSFKEEKYILIFYWMEKLIKEIYNEDIILLPETGKYRYVLIVQKNCKDIIEKLKLIHDMIFKMVQSEIIFSIGNVMLDIDSIVYSYNEALEGYMDGEVKNNLFFIKYYKPKSAMELLKIIPNDQVEKFCLHILKTLAYPKDEMMLELQKTLRIYLECNCNITETANIMFLHRNTVKYRIKKCEEILGENFSQGREAFQIQMSLAMVESKD